MSSPAKLAHVQCQQVLSQGQTQQLFDSQANLSPQHTLSHTIVLLLSLSWMTWNWSTWELGKGQGTGTAETTATGPWGLISTGRIVCTEETQHVS